MGHANLSNISDFWTNRLYALGKLSIGGCVRMMLDRGEAVHASEGDYENEGILGMSLTEVVHLQQMKDPRLAGWGGDGLDGGPWIEPILHPMAAKGIWVKRKPSEALEDMMEASAHILLVYEKGNATLEDATRRFAVTADAILDAGHQQWADYYRLLPRLRLMHRQWLANEDENWDWDADNPLNEGRLFDTILWRFCAGWRMRYREVPKIGNFTN